MKKTGEQPSRFVVCVRNDAYKASLERWKIYRLIPDSSAKAHQFLRVVDESGEDYLFPAKYFECITLPIPLQKSFADSNP